MTTHHLLQTLEHRLGLGADAASERKRRILDHVRDRKVISRDLSQDPAKPKFGAWLADKVAEFGGSWTFLSIFGAFLFVWAIINTAVLVFGAFDPFPFIFLNLMLSMLAAVQAPIILMSQNRQASKDRLTAQHDYEVNLKAELEIMALHEKFDQQLSQMQAKHDEQIRMLTDLVKAKG
jgi:uncharacterized membrane protein